MHSITGLQMVSCPPNIMIYAEWAVKDADFIFLSTVCSQQEEEWHFLNNLFGKLTGCTELEA